MKLSLMFCALILYSQHCFADESSEFGGIRKVDASKFASHFHLKGEIFVLDPTGRRFVGQLPEERQWTAGAKTKKIESNWSFKGRDIKQVVIHHEWELHDDNSVTGLIQEFEPGTPKGKMVREEKVTLENFAPVTWVVNSKSEYQVVIRFTPLVDSYSEPENLEKIRIGGDRGSFQVTDNQGYLWGDGVRFGGIIVGLKSHRGAFVISFYPFKGAVEMGTAHGKMIELKVTDKLKVKIQNDAEVVPGDAEAKVYGIYRADFKTPTPNSTWSFGQDTYEGIPKEFLEVKK